MTGAYRGLPRGRSSQLGLAYERCGAGPPLILLHGIGHRRQAWNAVLGRLVWQRELILVDLPGHGDSPPLSMAGRSVAQALVDDIICFLDDLGLDRPHLAGNSLGGRLALEAAVRGRAASVTAFSPAGFWRSSRELLYARTASKIMEAAARVFRPLGPALSRSTPGRALIYADVVNRPSRVSPEQAQGDMAAYLAARSTINTILAAPIPFFGAIPADVPVTIAWGTRDRLLPPRQALVAKERLPSARLVALPGCGHVPMTDDPQLVADVLLRGSRTGSGLIGQLTDVGLGVPAAALFALARRLPTAGIPASSCADVSELSQRERHYTCASRALGIVIFASATRPIACRMRRLARCSMRWRCRYTPRGVGCLHPRDWRKPYGLVH